MFLLEQKVLIDNLEKCSVYHLASNPFGLYWIFLQSHRWPPGCRCQRTFSRGIFLTSEQHWTQRSSRGSARCLPAPPSPRPLFSSALVSTRVFCLLQLPTGLWAFHSAVTFFCLHAHTPLRVMLLQSISVCTNDDQVSLHSRFFSWASEAGPAGAHCDPANSTVATTPPLPTSQPLRGQPPAPNRVPSWFFLFFHSVFSNQQISKSYHFLMTELRNLSFKTLHHHWLAPGRARYGHNNGPLFPIHSLQLVIVLSIRIKHQADKFPSFRGLHTFLLLIMVPAPPESNLCSPRSPPPTSPDTFRCRLQIRFSATAVPSA